MTNPEKLISYVFGYVVKHIHANDGIGDLSSGSEILRKPTLPSLVDDVSLGCFASIRHKAQRPPSKSWY